MKDGATMMIDLNNLTGLTEAEAVVTIKAAGFVARVIRRDKDVFGGDCRFRQDRVNLEIDRGRVTKADIG